METNRWALTFAMAGLLFVAAGCEHPMEPSGDLKIDPSVQFSTTSSAILDQSFTSPGGYGHAINECCTHQAQTFTAGMTGTLAGVKVLIGAGNHPYPLQIQFRNTVGGAVGSTILGSTTLGTTGSDFSNLITFSSTIPIHAGVQYAIVATYPGAPTHYGGSWSGSSNHYPGGGMYRSWDGGITWQDVTALYDAHFQTFIQGANTDPVANDDASGTDEDVALSVSAPGVLANDTDADGDPLTAVLSQDPAKGTLTLNSDGSFTYVPGTNFNGTDQFAYMANDGQSNSNVATVTITVHPVNDAPAITTDHASVTVDEGQTATNAGTVGDVDDDAVTLSASVGAVTNLDGTWSWGFPTTDGPTESQTVTITADDGNGGVTQTMFALTVDNVAPTVGAVTVPSDPVDINDQPVMGVGAPFTDPGTGDTHTCSVDYDDESGPHPGTVSGGVCTGPGHSYSETGVYTITVEVTDDNGGAGKSTAETMIVIYDPSGGFVTGGGWIDSPVGAYKAMGSLTGKANFGFVSKYKKGATVPTGNTEFQFKTADLNFHSSSYEWLVVNQGGGNAQFRGSGAINGEGGYRFMLWAKDDPDTFRIKIWTEKDGTETVVYDNGDGGTALGGGSIVIHTK